jgi:AraC-like DNA-binding protein
MQIWESPPSVKLVASGRRQSGRNFYWHDHPFYELGIVLSGQCDWRIGRRRRLSLEAGEAILLKPKTLHCEEIRAGGEAQLAWVGFDFGGKSPDWSQRAVATGDDFGEIADYIEIIAREHHQPGLPSQVRVGLAAQSILLLMARRAEQAPAVSVRPPRTGSDLNSRQVNRVESAAHYFRTNLQDALSIAQVAAYHSLCPAHFSSLFRRHHRMSPRSFLRQARLEKAAALLTTSDLTLKEIAAQCGFVDAAHLCKAFKQARGVTPRQFRIRPMVRLR